MFNTNLIEVLIKILGWIVIVVWALLVVSGVFITQEEPGDPLEKAGFFIGYELAVFFSMAFLYVLLAIFYKINNSSK